MVRRGSSSIEGGVRRWLDRPRGLEASLLARLWEPRVRAVGRLLLLAAAGAAIGILAEWSYGRSGVPAPDLARDAAVGWAFIGAGLVAWGRQPANRTGPLMVAVGFAWFLGNFEDVGVPALFSLAYWLAALNLALVAHLILAYPKGRLDSRAALVVVTSAYLMIGVVGFADMATYDPAVDGVANYLCVQRCPTNPLLLVRVPGLFTAIHRLYYAGGVLLGLAIVCLIVRRWVAATRPGRRFLTPVWVSMFVLAVIIVSDGAVALGSELSDSVGAALVWLSDVGQLAVPLAFLLGLLRMQLAHAAVGELVIELGEAPPPARLRDALARTLGDPSLQVGFWVPDANGYVTAEGRPLAMPSAASGRMLTLVEQAGQPLAALVHDPALVDDPRLVDAVRAAARLGLENERLHAELRARLDEVPASRRILEAADAERRRIERNLHDGAQQRLVSVSFGLRLALERLRQGPDRSPEAMATVAGALAELRRGLDDLRDLARGIHPAVLVQHGLGAAVTSLAEAAPLPVVVRIPDRRYPVLTESIAYYVACEAVSNTVRHSDASRVEVSARQRPGWLVLEVVDDGAGGADIARGTGLRGLADRVAALGGRFEVQSPPGKGTRVRAELPYEDAPACE